MQTPSPSAAIERELASLRQLYGAKFNAITAALGYVSDGILRVEDGDIARALDQLRHAERILVDA